VEARYLFTHTGGKRNRIAGLPAAEGIVGGTADVMAIRTDYPYQTLDLVPENAERPAFRLWAAYVPEDAEQRTCHAFGLLMIEKPGIPGLLQVARPFIRRFTERVFAEDRNHEVFPLILDVREVPRANGVPLRARAAACGSAALCDGARLPDDIRGQD
jgi:hypothetical protein